MKYLQNTEGVEAISWMQEAAKVAEKALCLRAKCGTVIVKDGEIIGRGYNAPPLDYDKNRKCLDEYDFSGKPKYDHTCCMHAEWRAILDAVKENGEKLKGSKLYFTRVDENGDILKSGEPFCTVCSRFALDVGIAEFLLWHEAGVCSYDTEEYNNLSYNYKDKKAI
ncbi:MAG: dCMP deaminase [Patescibacteria group bacterium]|nr:dCMP deaminase [Patescibacteria group bacterium]